MGSLQSNSACASIMSRYPSAYGHTPTYKSVGGLSSYPSALSSSSTSSSSLREMDREMGAMKRGMDRDFGVMTTGTSLGHAPLSKYSSGLAGRTGETSTSYQSKSYSSTSSSVGGGVPHHSSTSDSVSRSTRTGPGNIPHTSYSHTSSSFDSDRPYRNNVSSFSYNI